jgi:hypothetical protein
LRTAAAPAAAAPAKAGAAPAAQRPAPTVQRAAAPIIPTIKPLDKGLIYGAAVASLIAIGGVVWVFLILTKTVQDFSS